MSRSIRQLERRVETAESRTIQEKREEVAHRFKRLNVRELAILAHRFPTADTHRLPAEEKEVLARFGRLVSEAEEVFDHPEILGLLKEVMADSQSHVQSALKRMGVEPWASSNHPY